MSFVPLIDAVPKIRLTFMNGGAYSDIPLAIDTDTTQRVFVRASLEEGRFSGRRFSEFAYSIGVVAADDSHDDLFTQDRDIAARYIPSAVRPLVLPIVCAACELLVQSAGPIAIYRVTKGSGLPARALAKHLLITELLVKLGYLVRQTGTDAFRRMFWYHEYVDPQPVS